jgi:hypothetical protein
MALRVKSAGRAANEIRKAAEWWQLNRPAAPGAIGVLARAAQASANTPSAVTANPSTRNFPPKQAPYSVFRLSVFRLLGALNGSLRRSALDGAQRRPD